MPVWSSAFHHQFLDGNLLNFNAAPGPAPVVLFDGPLVQPTPPPEQRGFTVRPGHRFGYAFDPGFNDVIGVDIKLDITFPQNVTSGQLLGNVTLANGAIRLPIAFVSGLARLQLFVGSDVTAVSVPIDPDTPLRIHARWHSHGQGHILVNGTLRRYRSRARTRRLLHHRSAGLRASSRHEPAQCSRVRHPRDLREAAPPQ